jgi:hypothetical protein
VILYGDIYIYVFFFSYTCMVALFLEILFCRFNLACTELQICLNFEHRFSINEVIVQNFMWSLMEQQLSVFRSLMCYIWYSSKSLFSCLFKVINDFILLNIACFNDLFGKQGCNFCFQFRDGRTKCLHAAVKLIITSKYLKMCFIQLLTLKGHANLLKSWVVLQTCFCSWLGSWGIQTRGQSL